MNLGGTVHINKRGFFVLFCCTIILFVYLFWRKENNAANKINLRQLLAVAIEAAESGGREVVAVRENLKIESKGKTKEGANDSVTTADYKSHCVMLHQLKMNFPNLHVISEEEIECVDKYSPIKTVQLDKTLIDEWVNENDIKVWIDPLDATQEYTEKLYDYVTTMVCIAINGVPIVGVIHNPFQKSTSWAWVGKGSSFESVKPRESPTLSFIVSRSHTGKVKEIIAKSFKQKVEIVSAGGAGYKVLQLIEGKADAYVHVTAIKKWDICAGNAILNAAGGKMTTRQNAIIDYSNSNSVVNENGLIATLNNHQFYVDKFV